MFFLWLIFYAFLIIALFATLSIKLEFQNFVISLPKEPMSSSSENGKIKLKIYLFKKIKIFSKNLRKVKSENLKFNQIKDLLLKLKKNKRSNKLKVTKVIKKLNISFEKVNLEMAIGLENASYTALTVGYLYVILENIFTRNTQNFKNCEIKPVYHKNILWLKFDGIFKIDMWNIINTALKYKYL